MKIDHPSGETKTIRLTQDLLAFSRSKTGRLSERRYFTFTSDFLFEERKNDRPGMLADVRISTPSGTDALDSVMLIILDNEKIRIVTPEKLSAIENGSFQLMNRRFRIPENLWISVAFSQRIGYRFYLGKEEIEVKLTQAETAKLKEFFSTAIQRRDATIPVIPPGKAKW
jgi:hypothetical protein